MAKGAPKLDDERVRVARGPLAVEALLRVDVQRELERLRADPSLLRAPICIVVPSQSLRVHVARRLVEWSDSACVGFRVATLSGLARAVCRAGTLEPARGTRLFEALVAEASSGHGTLGSELAAFEDDNSAVAATLADFFDAGFEEAHAEPLDDALADALAGRGLTKRAHDRARALVDAAVLVDRSARSRGLARASHTLRTASDALVREPDLVRARAVWIHGYADATGRALDLLSVLARASGARVYFDACADGDFGARLREVLGIHASASDFEGDALASPPSLTRAASIDGEVRAVADRIRAALDAGRAPESIAVVARDLGPYRTALRRQFTRLGIPFSSASAHGLDGPAERRAKALAELLANGAQCRVERWLDARATETAAGAFDFEVVIAVRMLGVASIADLAAFDLATRLGGRSTFPLPVRAAAHADVDSPDDERDESEDADDDEDAEDATADQPLVRRTVSASALASEIECARRTVALLATWPDAATFAQHSAQLQACVSDVLGWNSDTDSRAHLDRALDALESDLPPALPLDAPLFHDLLAQALVEVAAVELGGAGSGVQVASVVDARGRTCDELFVLGLVRGRFPRTVAEDPLLPDHVRARLGVVLPDLPRKLVGRDEERALFDSLVRSSARVHLSWLTLAEDGKALLPSILLERVATPEAIANAPLAPEPHVRSAHATRPAHEHALLGALDGGIDGFAALLPAALAEVRALAGLPAIDVVPLARARSAILREFEPALADAGDIGPYFGFVGNADRRDDVRNRPLFVTSLEATAACGWKALLTRFMRLEPPLDPLAALPDLDARLIGNVVHDVLARIVGREPSRVHWPEPARVSVLVRERARSALQDAGILLAGFDVLIASRVEPMVSIARALDESESSETLRTLGSELDGSLPVADGFLGARTLAFRADRADESATGKRFTDYKTGAPFNAGAKLETRAKHHLDRIARGTKLQALAYARAGGPGSSGRYVFLKESAPEHARVFEMRFDDERGNEFFDDAVETLLRALDSGALFPRLLASSRTESNALCKSCEAAIACLRGDSTAHRRLAAFTRTAPKSDDGPESAALALWSLAERSVPAVPKEPKATSAKKRSSKSP